MITPTLDAAPFIRATLESVRSQVGVTFEHIVVDAGSTDGTLDILAEYPAVRVEKDAALGQAAAINFGAALASGDILAVLNGDDTYAPGALALVARAFENNADAILVYGEAHHIDEDGKVLERYPTLAPQEGDFRRTCFICQPAAFVRRAAFLAAGGMDVRRGFSLDYDLWIRLAERGRFVKVEENLAYSRMHKANKSLSKRGPAYRDSIEVLREHFGYVPYPWIYAYGSWLLDRKDHFYESSPPSLLKVGLSLALGLFFNARQPIRYFADWLGHRSLGR